MTFNRAIHLKDSWDASYSGPGDIASGAVAWWGFRAFNATVATALTKAVTVTDQSNANATIDLFLQSDGKLNLGPLAGITGHTFSVATLYDQAANTYHVTQATVSKQPAFNLTLINSLPGMFTTQTSAQGLVYAGGAFTQTQPLTYVAVAANLAATTNGVIIDCASSETDLTAATPSQTTMYAGAFKGTNPNAPSSTFYTALAMFNGTSSRLFINGTEDGTAGNAGTNAIATSNIGVGIFGNGTSLPSDINFVEGGIWNGDKTGNAVTLNSNQTTYWGPF